MLTSALDVNVGHYPSTRTVHGCRCSWKVALDSCDRVECHCISGVCEKHSLVAHEGFIGLERDEA